jgi:predicted adenine nucleotide alpha hydrolase (AANH) superfamily ATPase
MKLLLHTCCGPCSAGSLKALDGEGIRPVLFWYNPNIHPWTEYRSRRDCLEGLAQERGLELIKADEYGLRPFVRAAAALEDGACGAVDARAGRCSYCYRIRLEKTAEKAQQRACDGFSSTLLISPYQKHEAVREAGEKAAAQYGVQFFYRDFRPFFREGQKYAREKGFYMQKYCGCIFSEEERYAP